MDKMQRLFSLYAPNTVFGVGAVGNVGTFAKGFGSRKALIVTDAGVAGAGLLDAATSSLEASAVAFGLFDECLPDAPLPAIVRCSKAAKEGKYDLIIAVGGGSVIDTAKVASLCLADEGEIRSLVGFDRVKERGMQKIFIPTTAGTGSEVTRAAVITDTSDGKKKGIYSKYLWADVAVVDPLMTLNLPQKITADSGFDALSHAIEAYATWNANVVSDMFAETAIRLVAENLPVAYAKGRKNVEARRNMAIAAPLGIIAAESAGAGIAHSMNYPMAAKAKITHGAAISIILPHVMEYNIMGNPLKFGNIARLMGEKTEHLSLMDAAGRAAEAVRDLARRLGLPQRMRDVGVNKDDIPGFVDYLFEFQLYGMENNARDLSREDAAGIFEAAY
jgi:alcohol dehydrogenase class IV